MLALPNFSEIELDAIKKNVESKLAEKRKIFLNKAITEIKNHIKESFLITIGKTALALFSGSEITPPIECYAYMGMRDVSRTCVPYTKQNIIVEELEKLLEAREKKAILPR